MHKYLAFPIQLLFLFIGISCAISQSVAPLTWPTWSGTGFVVNSDGYLITCNHVVKDTALLQVYFKKKVYSATVIRTDEVNDLALLQIKATGLQALPLANGIAVKKGTKLRVFGYPLANIVGTDLKVSGGMISGTATVDKQTCWQTDAAINGGNSGGPATDLTRAVLGVSVAGMKVELATGMNFIVPVKQVENLLLAARVSARFERLTRQIA